MRGNIQRPNRDHTETDYAATATDHIGRGRLTKTWKCVQERGEGVIGGGGGDMFRSTSIGSKGEAIFFFIGTSHI